MMPPPMESGFSCKHVLTTFGFGIIWEMPPLVRSLMRSIGADFVVAKVLQALQGE